MLTNKSGNAVAI